ncbi:MULTISPECIES: type VI secretion system lipoprotein TssJ [Pseudomonas]|uniref:type VI secretion system lipoprotein TssJ n=1 Tax=Pseudomonas TaxID=286 RepID=UPI00031EFF68|nr:MULTISPECIES: type VI secretion system lipoprotein TssJ [Pseudomonas]AOS40379.1 type VI secretion protein [Pseudomonas brassicacearum]KIR17798.1 Type VI secretion lipoprotein [Pseudomonas fluorescens]ROM91361.1 type VI secretion system-associated lipoprotein [Pseudomonas brassicacearum]RON03294.1 type VI secretion system-associated lipoprotein [Pseudomonas brassicacearum]
MSHCTMHVFKTLAALAMTLLLGGCTTLSPFSTMTKLTLTLTASDQLNPDLNGRPSPVVVRLFELRHPVAFENSDFFSLYERARETLAPDLISSEELELRPGETVELRLGITGNGRYVGILAAYRDLPHARWRYTLPVAATQLTEANLILDQDGIANTLERQAKVDDR